MNKNQTISNWVTGESLTMVVNEEESAGTLQLYRVHLPPRRLAPPLHFHRAFTETFTAVEGVLDMYVGHERKHVRLHPGERLTAQINQPHTFANTADAWCTITVETRPPGGVVKAFQIAYGVANDGGAKVDGLPRNPLVRLRFIEIAQGFLLSPPLPFQRLILWLAALVAKLTGVERRIQRYVSDQEHCGISHHLTRMGH